MIARLRLLLRGATTAPALSLFLVVVIAALSYLGVAAPTVLAEGRTATVQRAVSALPDLSRWLSATDPGLPAFDDAADEEAGVWGPVMTVLEQKRAEQPEPLRSLLGAPRLIVTVDSATTADEDPDRVDPVPRNRVSLVSDPGLAARADLVEGRMPQRTGPEKGIEIVLTENVAEQLAWPVGSVRSWEDTTVTLTGVIAPTGRDDGDWAFISGSAAPLVDVDGGGNSILVGAGFMHPDQAAVLTDRVGDIKTSAWMPFDGAGLDASTAATTAAQLRLLAADPAAIPMYDRTFYNRGLAFSSALPQTLDTGAARGDAMTAVVAVAAVGPATVAFVVLALVTRMLAVRRIGPARVLRARGASTSGLLAMLGGEGLALGLLGAVIWAGVAAIAPGWAGAWVIVIPLVLAAVPAVVLPWGALADADRHARRDLGESADASPGRRAAGRLALEGLILVLSVVLAVLIVVRGGAGGADPLLLALPVVLGAAGSILSLRLLPVLLRAAERRGARGSRLAPLLGPARARRDPVVRTAPVLAVVVGVGVAVFSVAFAATVSGGIIRSAQVGVGADVRVDAAYITPTAAERVAGIDSVTALAALHGDGTSEASAGSDSVRVHVYTIDRDAFVAVQDGSAGALPLPAELTGEAGEGIPVVASQKLVDRLVRGADEAPGIEVGGTPVDVVGTAPAQVPFGAVEQWVIVDTAHAAELGQRGTGMSQLYLALAPGAEPDAVGAAAVAALGDGASFDTPARAAAVYSGDPAFALVQGALLAASILVAVLLGVAVIAMLVLGAPARARMLAILRTLGHPARAAGRLVAWEVVPALLVALPFGVGAGIAMAWLIIPQLDLRGFVGGPEQPPVVLGGAWPLIVVAGFALVAGIAVVAATGLAARLGAAEALRADDERDA